MSIQTKKLEMADKMYKQNSTGGKGTSPKDYMNGKDSGYGGGQTKKMIGKGKGKESERTPMANTKGSFKNGYSMANPKGAIKGGYKQANT